MTRNAPRLLDRRQVLSGFAALTTVPLLASCSAKPSNTLIIGGGLSGLVALDELRRGGHDAHLLEGGGRVGGRVRTFRDGLKPGLRAEAGAERVPQSHEALLALLGRLGIATKPYAPFESPMMFRIDGKLVPWDGDSFPAGLERGLSKKEKGSSLLGMHLCYTLEGDLAAEDDKRSGLEWMRSQGLSDAGERLLQMFCPFPMTRMKAREFQEACRHSKKADHSHVVEGGSDRITEALAAAHTQHITRGARIVALERRGPSWTAIEQSGKTHRANQVVLCLSLEASRRLRIQGDAGAMVQRRCNQLEAGHEIKVHMQISKAARKEAGHGSFSLGETFPRITWCLPEESEGRVIVNAMAIREDIPILEAVLRKGDFELQKFMETTAPKLATLSEKTLAYDWKADDLIGGTYAFSPPGRTGTRAVERKDNLLLAGGDFSSLPGWMEGAIHSAQDAVKESLK